MRQALKGVARARVIIPSARRADSKGRRQALMTVRSAGYPDWVVLATETLARWRAGVEHTPRAQPPLG